MDEREAANRSIADHVERTRRLLADGKTELDRQRAALEELNMPWVLPEPAEGD